MNSDDDITSQACIVKWQSSPNNLNWQYQYSVDKDIGAGALDITTMTTFQENDEGAIKIKDTVNLPQTRTKNI